MGIVATDLENQSPQRIELDKETKSEKKEFRDYDNAPQRVKDFYRINHIHQTLSLVLAKKAYYLHHLDPTYATHPNLENVSSAETVAENLKDGSDSWKQPLFPRKKPEWFGVWEQLVRLNALVDDSDPDTSLSQIQHAYQSAEKARKDGKPRWFQLTCLIHDLGKVLALQGEPQHLVVGDTFPVGCAFSPKVIYHDYFKDNSDSKHPVYSTRDGIYKPGCGIDNIHLSWGHDEYLYHVVKPYLPPEALYIIRYHSFYSYHRDGAYSHFMNETDRKYLPIVQEFNPYDLYSKGDPPAEDDEELRDYYQNLIREFFPEKILW